MQTKPILILISLFLCLQMEAQDEKSRWQDGGKNPFKIQLTGTITDLESGSPMEFATVSVFSQKDSSVIAGGLSNIDGKFELQVDPRPSYVIIEYIAYEPVIINPLPIDKEVLKANNKKLDLGIIKLSQGGIQLDEIEVRAEKSETTFSLDKRVFNVGKDLANRGGTAEDILDNVPSVSVDIDGNVSLRGSSGVRMLVNGRPSGLVGADNANGLRSIPANLIEKVEVITNPSARYEAEGLAGILNIVLKKEKGSGFNGAFDVTAGYPEQAGVGANVNYRKGNVNWFLNYGLNYRENPGGGFTYQERTVDDTLFILDQTRDQNRTSFSNTIRFALDYFLSEKEQLTGAFLFRKSDEENFSELTYDDYVNSFDNLGFIGSTYRTDEEEENESDLEYSLNYRREFSSRNHELTATVQFSDDEEVEGSNLVETYTPSGENAIAQPFQRSDNSEGTKNWLFQIDYTHPFSKDHKFETGLRSTLREIDNIFQVKEDDVLIPEFTNNFLYDEDIHAAYLIYGNTFGKFSFQAGLRSEYSIIRTELKETVAEDGVNERDYLDFFPSGHLNYAFSEKYAVQLSYSRRVRRPRFWDLNPFFTFADPRNFFTGNPNTNPEYTDSYELSKIVYWDKASFTGSIFYRQTDQTIQRILVVDDFQGTTLRIPLNVGTKDDLGIDVTFSYSALKWLRLDGNFAIYNNQLSVNEAETSSAVEQYYRVVRGFSGSSQEFQDRYTYDLQPTDNVTWDGRLTSRISFWSSDLQLRFNYRGPRDSSQGTIEARGSLDIGWSKDFLNKDLTLTLSVRDVFNSRRRAGTTELDDFFQESEFQWRSRFATLNASYRINQNKKRGSRRGGYGGFEGQDF